jgi:hypothetical protein
MSNRMVTLNPIKKRKKVKYVEYDINYINNIIYNDLENPIFEETKQINWNINKVLEKGETYKSFNSNSGYHFITSFGRIINGKRLIQLTIQNVRDSFLRFFVDQNAYKLEEEMEKVGFVYDIDKIKAYYKTTNNELKIIKG